MVIDSQNPKISFVSQSWWLARLTTTSFSGQWRFLWIKLLQYTFQLQQKKGSIGNNFGVFYSCTLNCILNKKLTHRCPQLVHFSKKTGHFFSIFIKKAVLKTNRQISEVSKMHDSRWTLGRGQKNLMS